jgi:hypothetical protein
VGYRKAEAGPRYKTCIQYVKISFIPYNCKNKDLYYIYFINDWKEKVEFA